MRSYYVVEPNETKKYSIVFRLEVDVKEIDIPEIVSDLRDEVEKLQIILEVIFKDDEPNHNSYYERLIETAQAGVGVDEPQPNEAMKDIANMKKEIKEIHLAGKICKKHLALNLVSFGIALIVFIIFWIFRKWFNDSSFFNEYQFILLGTYVGMNILNLILPNKLDLENVIKWLKYNNLLLKDLWTTTLISFILYIFVKTGLFDVTLLGTSIYSLLQAEKNTELYLIVFGLIIGLLNKSLFGNLRSKINGDLENDK